MILFKFINLNLKKNETRPKKRFIKKEEEEIKIVFGLPSIKKLMMWIIISAIMMPWISIIIKNNMFQKLLDAFDALLKQTDTEQVSQKKMDYFHK